VEQPWSSGRRLWLTDRRGVGSTDGTAVPIRTVLGAPVRPGRTSRMVRVGASWGIWVLALGGVGVGACGVWHLLYGDRVEGQVWLGRPPAPLATTTTSTTTTTTTTTPPPTTTVATTASAPATVADDSSGPGSGRTQPEERRGSSANAGPSPTVDDHGGDVTSPRVTTADDHGGNGCPSGNSGSGSSGSGSGSSGSGSSGDDSSGSGHGGGSGHD
jgi:hypothetical protein